MVKERVLVLRKIKYGEADLILHCLDQNGARISFLARGALKSKKRFSGGILEPTHFIEVQYRSKPEEPGKLIPLEQASLVNEFPGIRTDYDKLELALYILDCVAKVSMEGELDSQSLFNLVGHSLKQIEQSTELPKLKMHFQLKFLYQQGVLNIENWMADFLRAPVAQNKEVIFDDRELINRAPYVSQLVQQFIATAEAH